jgi:phosphotransferase system HPr-like phosphotransfer protein
MMLAAEQGSTLYLTAAGDDAHEAAEELEGLLLGGLDDYQ